jgi:hypothetical protein
MIGEVTKVTLLIITHFTLTPLYSILHTRTMSFHTRKRNEPQQANDATADYCYVLRTPASTSRASVVTRVEDTTESLQDTLEDIVQYASPLFPDGETTPSELPSSPPPSSSSSSSQPAATAPAPPVRPFRMSIIAPGESLYSLRLRVRTLQEQNRALRKRIKLDHPESS